jgi:hypothetical protein
MEVWRKRPGSLEVYLALMRLGGLAQAPWKFEPFGRCLALTRPGCLDVWRYRAEAGKLLRRFAMRAIVGNVKM